MKNIILISIILTLNYLDGNSQSRGLLLKHKFSNDSALIAEGKIIKVKLEDGTRIKGNMYLIKDQAEYADSAILINTTIIHLSNIDGIKFLKDETKVLGITFIAIGIAIAVPSIIILGDVPSEIESWEELGNLIVGALGTVIGGNMAGAGTLITIIGKKYAHNRWNYIIKRQ